MTENRKDSTELEKIFLDAIEKHADEIFNQLATEATRCKRYICICRGHDPILDHHTTAIFPMLQKRGIQLDTSNSYTPFECTCKDQATPCSAGYVLYF